MRRYRWVVNPIAITSKYNLAFTVYTHPYPYNDNTAERIDNNLLSPSLNFDHRIHITLFLLY